MEEEKLIYPELSYKIIGIAFKIYNQLGHDIKEKYVQKAFEMALKEEGIKFIKEKEVKIK